MGYTIFKLFYIYIYVYIVPIKFHETSLKYVVMNQINKRKFFSIEMLILGEAWEYTQHGLIVFQQSLVIL